MRSSNWAIVVLAYAYGGLLQAQPAPSNFSGVWSMVKQDGLGAPFLIPAMPMRYGRENTTLV